jgi:hypothetical protein
VGYLLPQESKRKENRKGAPLPLPQPTPAVSPRDAGPRIRRRAFLQSVKGCRRCFALYLAGSPGDRDGGLLSLSLTSAFCRASVSPIAPPPSPLGTGARPLRDRLVFRLRLTFAEDRSIVGRRFFAESTKYGSHRLGEITTPDLHFMLNCPGVCEGTARSRLFYIDSQPISCASGIVSLCALPTAQPSLNHRPTTAQPSLNHRSTIAQPSLSHRSSTVQPPLNALTPPFLPAFPSTKCNCHFNDRSGIYEFLEFANNHSQPTLPYALAGPCTLSAFHPHFIHISDTAESPRLANI